VTVGGEKGVQDDITLTGALEPLGGDKIVENFLLGALQTDPVFESEFHFTNVF
jgi:hypothetical protein